MKTKKVARKAFKTIRKNGLTALGWVGTSAAMFGAGMLATSMSGRVHGRMRSMIDGVRARLQREGSARPVVSNGARAHAAV